MPFTVVKNIILFLYGVAIHFPISNYKEEWIPSNNFLT